MSLTQARWRSGIVVSASAPVTPSTLPAGITTSRPWGRPPVRASIQSRARASSPGAGAADRAEQSEAAGPAVGGCDGRERGGAEAGVLDAEGLARLRPHGRRMPHSSGRRKSLPDGSPVRLDGSSDHAVCTPIDTQATPTGKFHSAKRSRKILSDGAAGSGAGRKPMAGDGASGITRRQLGRGTLALGGALALAALPAGPAAAAPAGGGRTTLRH